MIETSPKGKQERALLIGLEQEGVSKWDLRDSMEELRELASSAGAHVVDTVTQKLQKPTAPYYIGKGKAELIKESFQDQQVTSVIFDNELSPAQGRNLENLFSRKVLDRTQLILDIFAQRARSREGRLQIELAQLQYLLPRLTRMWTHLSRQTGGIGTRGPGETQLEVDRRRVQERIARLERELEGVRKVRVGSAPGPEASSMAGRGRCRLHQRREIDPAEFADRRRRRRGEQTFRDARSDDAQSSLCRTSSACC